MGPTPMRDEAVGSSLLIQGAKGGKGGGGGTPTEAPDSLRSKAYARVVDLVSEGEIQGLVNGLKSVLLDGVPLRNADDSDNFKDYKIDWRYGTQGQTAMSGFDDAESEVAVGVKVTTATPVVRTITNASANKVRVTLSFPALSETDTSNGDIKGVSVEYWIDVQSNGGGYVPTWNQTVTGKSSSGYQRSVTLDLPGSPPWDIRLRRITADSASQYLLNEMWWYSYAEIISTRLRYPNSAIVGMIIDSQQFSRIPVRGYDLLGVRIRVPTNYDPITRNYSGQWDGTFKIAWTNNPAWCFYELLTNERWGLGRYIDETLVNKWTLYTIGQYCDQLVDDGKGGTEPRFTLNAYLQTREEAYEMVKSLASVFRSMVYWGPSGVDLAQDAPRDATALFTNANVVDGTFNYEESSAKQRYTTAVVQWNDPFEQFRAKQVYVEDAEGIERYGVIQTEVVAFGCTSQGQAIRFGKWLLYSGIHETEVVTFRVGLEGLLCAPGHVIKVADSRKSRERRGGRIKSATTTAITVDDTVVLNPGETYTLYVMDPDSATPVITRPVTNPAGSHTVLNLGSALPSVPTSQSVWMLSSNMVMPTTWRVLSVAEEEAGNEFTITAVSHNPSKYAAVEQGLKLEDYPVRRPAHLVMPPTNVTLTEHVFIAADSTIVLRLNIAWSDSQLGLRYRVSYRREYGEWVSLPDTAQKSVDLENVQPGLYEVEVRTIGLLGYISSPAVSSIILGGKITGPGTPDTLSVDTTVTGQRVFTWTLNEVPLDIGGFEVRYEVGPTGTWEDMNYLFSLPASAVTGTAWRFETTLPVGAGTYTFAIKSIDTSGNYCEFARYAYNIVLGASETVKSITVSTPSELFKIDKDGNPVNNSIVLTATLNGGLTGFVTWSAGAGYTGTPPTGTNTWTVNSADQTADIVTYTASLTVDLVEYTDSVTLVRVKDGSEALTALLTNESHTVAASATGVVSSFSGAGGEMRLYRGSTRLTSGVTYSIQTNTDALTASINGSGVYSVTAAGSWANASTTTTITFRATHTASGATFDKVFTLTKSLAGTEGATGNQTATVSVYKWDPNTPAGGGLPSGSSTYTWANGQHAQGTLTNGWTVTVPNNPGGTTKLWRCTKAIVAPGGTISTGVDWASGYTMESIIVNGDPGAAGNQAAAARLYRWYAGTPPDPTLNATSTYTWATAAHTGYSASGDGWTTTAPANPGTAGLQLWIAEKAVTATAGTVSSTVTWSSASYTKYAVSLNGDTGPSGANGYRYAEVVAFKWALTIPTATGSGTYTWSTGGISGYPSTGWAADAGTSTPGWTLWKVSVKLVDNLTAATSAISWGTGSITAVGYAGATGGTGPAGLSQRIAYGKTTLSSLGTGQVVTAGNSSYPPSNSWGGGSITWSGSVPTIVAGEIVYQTNGIYDGTNTTWEAPFMSTLKVGSLSAITVNTGSLTVNGELNMTTTGYIRGGMTGYNAGSGFFLGYSGGAYKFSLGNSAGNKITWDGSTLAVPAATITGTLTAAQINTNGLTIKDASGNVIFGSGATINPSSYMSVPSGWQNTNVSINANGTLSGAGSGQVTLPGIGHTVFRAVTAGNTAYFGGQAPTTPNLYKNGAVAVGVGRSYTFIRIRRSDGVITFSQTYDVYTSTTNATNLATAMNATGSDSIAVLISFDEPWQNRTTTLKTAVYRCGGSPGIFGSDSFFQFRSAYILVGIGGCGQGNGAEFYKGDYYDDPYAWLDVAFTLVDGNPVFSGSGSQPRIDSSNISTYIASAAIGNAQIGTAAIGTAQIGTGVITSAKIGDGEITNAKIGNLQVDTIKIANNSVTTMKVGSNQSGGTYYNGNFITHVGDYVYIPDSTTKVLILASFRVSKWIYANYQDEIGTIYHYRPAAIRIRRNNTTSDIAVRDIHLAGGTSAYDTGGTVEWVNVSLVETPGAGWHIWALDYIGTYQASVDNIALVSFIAWK